MIWLIICQWLAMFLALLGMVFNNHKKRVCFVIWFAGSILGIILYIDTELWGLVVRDIIYLVLFIHGYLLWGRKENRICE